MVHLYLKKNYEIRFSIPGTCRVLVRRHDRFRTAGPDTVLREAEQG